MPDRDRLDCRGGHDSDPVMKMAAAASLSSGQYQRGPPWPCYRCAMDLLGRYRSLYWVLVVLNVVVLLGQLWPAGAPPFARVVNIAFLLLSLLTLFARVRQ